MFVKKRILLQYVTKKKENKMTILEKKRLPQWFKQSKGKLAATRKLSAVLEAEVPNSICQEARCPNRYECFQRCFNLYDFGDNMH